MRTERPLSSALAVLSVACQPKVGASIGVTHEREPLSTPAPSAPAPTEPTARRWEHWSESSTWPLVAAYPMRGHPGSETGELRTPPTTERALRDWSRGSRLPVGAIVVQVQRDELGSIQRLFTMTKLPERWYFEAFDLDGFALEVDDRPCTDCHAQATSDAVFGPPRR